MNKNNSDNNGIPTRKGVYLRNPGESKAKGSASSEKKARTSPTSGAAKAAASKKPAQAKANSTQAAKKTSSSNRSTSNIRKTPAEIAKEKELLELKRQRRLQLEAEKQKYEAMKKKERARKIASFKKNAIYIIRNVLFGIAAALAIILIIMIMYYRNMSKFSESSAAYSIELYGYIDESSEDAEIIKQLEARQNGSEKPQLVLGDEIRIKDNAAFIPFGVVDDFFDFTMSGDASARTVIVGSSQSEFSGDNSAVFFFDSASVKVNGASHSMSAGAFMSGNEMYIPYEFFETFVKGISVVSKEKSGSFSISITKTQPRVYFSASDNTPLEVPDISKFGVSSQSTHQYSIDLSEYEKYINPADPDAYLFLVNTQNRLDADYVPDDLADVIYTRNDRATQQMRLDAAKSLEAFLKAAYENGHSDVTVTSAYRSYAYQSSIFNSRLEQNRITYGEALAEAKTAEFTAYPGASEHQSGLCCDMHNLPSAMQSFANEEAYKWLYEHCADFGFILRYPKSKEEITGIKYEPWHYRFVGRYHAQKIMESGLSLEEYVANLSQE